MRNGCTVKISSGNKIVRQIRIQTAECNRKPWVKHNRSAIEEDSDLWRNMSTPLHPWQQETSMGMETQVCPRQKKKKKKKNSTFGQKSHKVKATAFWHTFGVMYIDFLPVGTTVKETWPRMILKNKKSVYCEKEWFFGRTKPLHG